MDARVFFSDEKGDEISELFFAKCFEAQTARRLLYVRNATDLRLNIALSSSDPSVYYTAALDLQKSPSTPTRGDSDLPALRGVQTPVSRREKRREIIVPKPLSLDDADGFGDVAPRSASKHRSGR